MKTKFLEFEIEEIENLVNSSNAKYFAATTSFLSKLKIANNHLARSMDIEIEFLPLLKKKIEWKIFKIRYLLQ